MHGQGGAAALEQKATGSSRWTAAEGFLQRSTASLYVEQPRRASSASSRVELQVDLNSDSDSSGSSSDRMYRCLGMHRPARSAVLPCMCAVWMVVGWLLYVGEDKLAQEHGIQGFISILYWQVQIFTTIGYGDMLPFCHDSVLTVMLYVLAGNLIFSLGALDYIIKSVSSHTHKLKKMALMDSVDAAMEAIGALPDEGQVRRTSRHALAYSVLFFAFVVGLGALFFGLVDFCICDEYEDCNRVVTGERHVCEELGGRPRGPLESLYMSIITVTTVGFGDQLPGNWLGRVFVIVWAPCGVASFIYLIGQCERHIAANNVWEHAHGMNERTFHLIDEDRNGTLSKSEFVLYMLMKYGMVEVDDTEMLFMAFNSLDVDRSGNLTYDEVVAHHDQCEQRHQGHHTSSLSSIGTSSVPKL